MTSKKTLLTVMCTLLFTAFYNQTIAQRRLAADKRPFIFQPRTAAPASAEKSVVPVFRVHSPYRSFDGTNNNIFNQRNGWGATDIPLLREIAAAYGSTDPKNAMNGAKRPSPRKISNSVVDEPVTMFNARGLSSFVYVWGQFIDHDMSLTPTDTVEYAPVKLPSDEVLFTEEIPFYRSEVRAGTGKTSQRQQTNLNTAWVDASMIYGSDQTRARWMRTFRDGKMKTSTGNYLPWNTLTGESNAAIDPRSPDMANDNGHTVKTFIAGDVRASEHPGILALHTLFVREHNRICARLIAQGLRNDEIIYQTARKEVGALIQAITYQEFLPAIGITLRPYRGYNDGVRPDISNIFATAGYRIGHTMVADDILTLDNNCQEVPPGEFDLVQVFWTPQVLLDIKPEPFLKGFAAHTQYETDTKINSVLRNMLFGSPSDPVRFGIDLGSLNIQRGRDHGLPDYNTIRRYYTGRGARSFSDITSDKTLADSLKALYGSVDNIDAWVGLLAENHLSNKSVGFTMHEILRIQFERLRDGDYYFYRGDPYLPANTRDQVRLTTFADVIKRNTKLTNLQKNVFFTEECPGTGEEDKVTEAAAMKAEIADPGQFRIYPNPVNNVLNIELTNKVEASTIRIYTTEGLLIKTVKTDAGQQRIQVNTNQLTSGMYMVIITSGKETKSFKFIKM